MLAGSGGRLAGRGGGGATAAPAGVSIVAMALVYPTGGDRDRICVM
jgi:hypothetical protein